MVEDGILCINLTGRGLSKWITRGGVATHGVAHTILDGMKYDSLEWVKMPYAPETTLSYEVVEYSKKRQYCQVNEGGR